jgi:tetratricopeptide (TPR) repeat protein
MKTTHFLALICISLFCSCPNLVIAQYSKGLELFKQNKYKEAKAIFEKIEEDSQDYYNAMGYLGGIAFFDGDNERAEELLENVLDEVKSNSDFYYWYGSAVGLRISNANMMTKAMNASKVKDSYEKAAKLDKNHLDSRFGLIEYYLQAPSMMGGSVENALQMANEINEINKIRGFFAKARVYDYQKDEVNTEKTYLQLIDSTPDVHDYHINLILFYQKYKRWEDAFKAIDNVLTKFPTAKEYHYQIIKTCSISNTKLEKADNAFKEYLTYQPAKEEPSHAWAYYRMGLIYELKKDIANAKTHYQKAVELDKDHKEAKEALKKLQ